MLEGLAIAIFAAMVAYVIYWSIKAEDSEITNRKKKKFELPNQSDSNRNSSAD